MKHIKYIIILCFLTAGFFQQSFAQNVTFKNELLEKHIKIQLVLDTLKPLPKAVADTVARLDCSSLALENIWDLRNFPELQEVDLSNNAITNIDVLAILPKLKVVNLFGNRLHEVDALHEADTERMIINVGNNHIFDFLALHESPYCFFTIIGEKSQKRSRFAEQNRINSLYVTQSNISSNLFVFYPDCWSNTHQTGTIDFGDGNTAIVKVNGFTDSLTHQYNNPGVYNVELSVGSKKQTMQLEVSSLPVINVCGEINNDATWFGNVIINCETTITEGNTLTIKPGTIIKFKEHYKLIVKGKLSAIGEENNEIKFTTDNHTNIENMSVKQGGWHGIRFIHNETTKDTSHLAHCVIEFGKATDGDQETNLYDDKGGGVFANYTNIKIENCTFRNNRASENGGAINIYNSKYSYLFNNEFLNNTGDSIGGAINFWNGEIELHDNTFYKNISYGWGGGAFIEKSRIVINNNTFNYNGAAKSGGGLYIQKCNGIFQNNTITNDTASWGGGIYLVKDSLTIENNTIINNGASKSGGGLYIQECRGLLKGNIIANDTAKWGGGIYLVDDTITVESNEIRSNQASYSGGGISLKSSPQTIVVNNRIINNNAVFGGAMDINYSSSNIVGNIIADNTASKSGGALYLNEDASNIINNTIGFNKARWGSALFLDSASVLLTNNVIWSNHLLSEDEKTITISGNRKQIHFFDNTSTPNFYNNNIEGGVSDFSFNTGVSFSGIYQNNINEIPQFIDAPDNFELQSNSLMINAGISNTSGLYLPEFDLLGNERIYDNRIDIGALEFIGEPTAIFDNKEKITGINVYPNPTEGIFTISVANYSVNELQLKIVNTLGQTIINKKMNTQTPLNVDLSRHGKGVYFIEFSSERNKTIEKLIVK